MQLAVRRVRCDCGFPGAEKVSWLPSRARLTNSLAAAIQNDLQQHQTISHVAQSWALSWSTVAKLEERYLAWKVGKEADLSRVQHLAIDEISFFKGHKYCTVIVDIERKQIRYMCLGKKQEDIQPFFERLRNEGRLDEIKSVSCDMNAAYPVDGR